MVRPEFDQSACDQLAQCVREIESETDAEIVIVVRARSGSYAGADYLFASLVAFAGLLFLLFSPFEFHYYWVAVDVLLLFLAGWFAASKSNRIRRWFSSESARAQAVRTHAAAMFYEAGIANTQSEMGVLIYLSLLERRLELIADRGVLKAAPAMEWNRHLHALTEAGLEPELGRLARELRALGTLLSRHLPATGENPNELPDIPRFELK